MRGEGWLGQGSGTQAQHPSWKLRAGMWPGLSAIAVGAAGVDGSRVLTASWPHQLPQAVAEVLHLAGAQGAAHPQQLGVGPAGAAGLEMLAPRGGIAGPPVWLTGLTGLPGR